MSPPTRRFRFTRPAIEQAIAARPMDTVSAATRTLGVLAELFEHTTDAILILDKHDNVVEANPRAELLLGARSGELDGVALVDMVPVGSPLLSLRAGSRGTRCRRASPGRRCSARPCRARRS